MTTRARIAKLLSESKAFLEEETGDGRVADVAGMASGRDGLLLVESIAHLAAWAHSYPLLAPTTAAYSWCSVLAVGLAAAAGLADVISFRVGAAIVAAFLAIDVAVDVVFRWKRRRAAQELLGRMRAAVYDLA